MSPYKSLARLADIIGVGVAAVDADGVQTYVNDAFADMLGYAAEELIGRKAPFAYWPADEIDRIAAAFEQTVNDRAPASGFELVFQRADGVRLDVLVKVRPISEVAALSDGWVAAVTDISPIKRASRRQRFLAEASRVLGSSLEYESTLASVAQMAVPALADYCLIDLVDDNGELRRVNIADRNPARAARLWEHWRKWPVRASDNSGIADVLRTGEGRVISRVSDDLLSDYATDPDQLASLRSMGIVSSIVVPMIARGRPVGVIALNSSESMREYDEDDLNIASTLAERAAIAVDNARLFQNAQAANVAKNEFLAVMSHELRTPLNAMIGYADLLLMQLHGPLTDRQRDFVERVKNSAFHQVNLVEGILGFSRLEAGRERVERGAADICAIIDDVAGYMRPLAEGKGLSMRVLRPETPISLVTDGGKLRQILLNLAANAVKFTQRGHVLIGVTEGSEGLQLYVEDTGVGIAPDKADLVFESFVQLDQSNTRVAGGTGLGLAISKKLAELLGARIELQSMVGEGSRFTIVLPCEAVIDA